MIANGVFIIYHLSFYYRTMHIVQSTVLLLEVDCPSLCVSVFCQSETLVICGHISWVSSKVITLIILCIVFYF